MAASSGNIAAHLRERSKTGDKRKVRRWQRPPQMVEHDAKEDEGEQKHEFTGDKGGWRGKKRRVQRGGNWKDRLHNAAVQGMSGFTTAKSVAGRLIKGALGAIRGATRKSKAQAWAGAVANNVGYRMSEPFIGDAAHGVGILAAHQAEKGVAYAEQKKSDFDTHIRKLARQEYKSAPDPYADFDYDAYAAGAPDMRHVSRPETAVIEHKKNPPKPVPRVYLKPRKRVLPPPAGHEPISAEKAKGLPGYKITVQGKVKKRLAQLADSEDVGLKWSQRRRKAGKDGLFTKGLEMVGLGKRPRLSV